MAVALASSFESGAAPPSAAAGGKPPVEALFADWRTFETPPSHEGAPDYRVPTFERRQAELARFRQRLAALEASTDLAQAKTFQVEWTPRGWMCPDLLGFEQQLCIIAVSLIRWQLTGNGVEPGREEAAP